MPDTENISNVLEFREENLSISEELIGLKAEFKALQNTLQDLVAIQTPLLGIDQIAAYFGKSPDTIRRWVKGRVISCYKLPVKSGYTYLFSMRQIEEDLEDYQINRI